MMNRLALLVLILAPALAAADVKETLDKARAALKAGKLDESLKLTEKALADQPNNAEARYLRGSIFMHQAKYEPALADFRATLEAAPEFAPAYDQIGAACFKLGLIKESLEAFDKFIALKPAEGPKHWRRGLTLYYAEKYADGVKQFTSSD